MEYLLKTQNEFTIVKQTRLPLCRINETIDGLMQERRNTSAVVIQSRLSSFLHEPIRMIYPKCNSRSDGLRECATNWHVYQDSVLKYGVEREKHNDINENWH